MTSLIGNRGWLFWMLAGLVMLGGCQQTSSTPIPEPTAESAIVNYVFDGDTIEVDLDGTTERVRLIGINSPEIGECWVDEARSTLADLLPEGTAVGMTTDVSNRDQFDRLLRYVWVDSLSVNEELVRRGAAVSRRYPPDTAMSDRFDAAQDEARGEDRGLWSCPR